ncbi:MAG: AAA family ATPase [Culicoidibacterales bacterium]
MFLKKIEAYGFKSFADKTVIAFEEPLTIVVGPNGSGKSNVVDAVRWVLGEQSAKTLRGDRMYDIIFGGSKSRPQMNIAEVTLTIDNSRKELPIAFDEVQVTRRLFRSGESEYILNKEKVRLQDIVTLFLDSGIGKESFSIIGQGKIDEILNSKPEARRGIFEEASGVVKYKYKKTQTLRKLDKTNENLLRVADIQTEIERQISPLRTQAKKAEKYNQLHDQLSASEVSVIVSEMETFIESETLYKQEMETRTLDASQLQVKIGKTEIEISQFETKRSEIEKQIEIAQQQYVEAKTSYEKVIARKDVLENQKHSLNAQLTQYQENEQSLRDFFTQTRIDVNGADFRENLLQTLKTRETAYTEKEQLANDIEQSMFNSQRHFQSMLSEKTHVEAKLQSIERMLEGNTYFFHGVKAVLDQKTRLGGIHDALGNVIQVDTQYQVAIDTALGVAMQHVIVDTPNDAKNAIQYLKESKQGRATFLPLSSIQPRQVDHQLLQKAKQHKGYINVASELIEVDSTYSNITKQLLGQTIIVDTIETGIAMARDLQNRVKLITLAGEVLSVGGAMSGGNTGKERQSILGYRNEERTLIEKVKTLSTELEQLETEQQTMQLKLQQIQVERQEMLTGMLEIKSQIDSLSERQSKDEEQALYLEEQIASIAMKKSQLESDLQICMSEFETIDSKIDEAREIVEKTEVAVQNLRVQALEQQSKLDQLIQMHRADESQIRVIEREMNQLEVALSRLELQMENDLERLSTVYQLTFEAAQKRAKPISNMDEVKREVENLRLEINRLGTVNIGAIEELERLVERKTFLDEQVTDLNDAKESLLSTIFEMDQEMVGRFATTFAQIQTEFTHVFQRLFGGGEAKLILTDEKNLLESGIDIVIQPPGKKLQHLSLLSGGERALTAIALLFAILKVKPIPFCILDEVEAALDEANVTRFAKYLHTFSRDTQFIVISHRKGTMEYADALFGVTMQESGVSRLVSVKLEEAVDVVQS